MIRQTRYVYFATCPRGLEPPLLAELELLGAEQASAVAGGVAFSGPLELCYRTNLESRIASRILLKLGSAPYKTDEDVYRFARGIAWTDRFEVARSIRVDVTASRSPLKSLEFVTLRIKDAICDCFRDATGERPNVDTRAPDVRISGFFDDKNVTLYLDTSGEPLWKRGWRIEAGEAPLRENRAAGILALTGWDGIEPLLDPMCGSGTFVIEAAMIALGIPPGHKRGFGFERLNGFDEPLWRRMREAALTRRRPSARLPIWAGDRSLPDVEQTRANLRAAGLEGCVHTRAVDVLKLEAPEPAGVLVANPPYGVRLEDKTSLAAFYPKLGDALKQHFAGWRCFLFSGDTELAKGIRLHPSRKTPLFNGALECRLYKYEIVAGSMRKDKA